MIDIVVYRREILIVLYTILYSTILYYPVERGYDVTVYERTEVFGGKARSFDVEGGNHLGDGQLPLPGEHGFRIWRKLYLYILYAIVCYIIWYMLSGILCYVIWIFVSTSNNIDLYYIFYILYSLFYVLIFHILSFLYNSERILPHQRYPLSNSLRFQPIIYSSLLSINILSIYLSISSSNNIRLLVATPTIYINTSISSSS